MYLLYFPLTCKHNTYYIMISEIPVENKMAHTLYFFSFCFLWSFFDFRFFAVITSWLSSWCHFVHHHHHYSLTALLYFCGHRWIKKLCKYIYGTNIIVTNVLGINKYLGWRNIAGVLYTNSELLKLSKYYF